MRRNFLAPVLTGFVLIAGTAPALAAPNLFATDSRIGGSDILQGEIGHMLEPTTLALFCTGVAVLIYLCRRRSA